MRRPHRLDPSPGSQAKRSDSGVELSAAKSWVTSTGYADVYVASTLSADVDGAIDLYAVADGKVIGSFRGMGLRGNASAPMQSTRWSTTGCGWVQQAPGSI